MWILVLPLLAVLGTSTGVSNVGKVQNILRYYNGRQFSQYVDIPVWDCGLMLSNLDHNGCENATIIVPRFGETLHGGSVQTIVEAYLMRDSKNVLAFDYLLEPTPFQLVISGIPHYAASLASAVECLVDGGIWPHLVGFSLGANVAGLAGKILKDQQKRLPRITGLDPPGLLLPKDDLLSSEFADMVDVIHTDAGSLGSYDITGTVDFYPNFGVASQPGCLEEKYMAQIKNLTEHLVGEVYRNPTMPPSTSLCSHRRAYQYYAESVLNEDSFLAVKKFALPTCASKGDITAYMGLATPQSATGCYFLTTKATCPFGDSHNPVSQEKLDVLCNKK